MCRCRIAQLVDRVHNRIARCIAADRVVHAPDIVVDRARQTDDRHARLLAEERPARERAVAADDHKPLDITLAQILERRLAALRCHERLTARRSEERAAALNQIADAPRCKLLDVIVHHAAVAVVHAVDLDPLVDRRAHHSARRRIHPRAVSARGHNRDCLFQHNNIPHLYATLTRIKFCSLLYESTGEK